MRSINDEAGGSWAAITDAVAVRSPKQTRELTLVLTPAQKVELQMARMREQQYVRHGDLPGTYLDGDLIRRAQKPAFQLPAAVGPPGAAITYAVVSSRLTFLSGSSPPAALTGLYFEDAATVRKISGTLPDTIGDYDVTYTASATIGGGPCRTQ